MTHAARHDRWQAGDSYDAYMGRWSRPLAARFVGWLDLGPGLEWLDVGCGTGALSAAIAADADPAEVIAIDASEDFVARARAKLGDPRVRFLTGRAESLPVADASRDAVVSGLVLNFLPDRVAALAEMRRAARPGGTVAFYVWDYPGGGLGFLDAFWKAAAAADPAAAALDEARRFPLCTPDALAGLAAEAGLTAVAGTALEVATVFGDFDDLWKPFTLGAGPAPGYCASLAPAARDRLREALDARLRREPDGGIAMTARAWAVRGLA